MAPFSSTLVIGGARSGKSRLAESLARSSGLEKVYVATAAAGDEEMAARIARHRADRGPDWLTIEEPIGLPRVIMAEARASRILVVDCLTLWLSNVLLGGRDMAASSKALLSALANARGPVIAVSNEVGLGIVPDSELGRSFRDAQGRLNQEVAAAMPRVLFVAAGLPLALKGEWPAGGGGR